MKRYQSYSINSKTNSGAYGLLLKSSFFRWNIFLIFFIFTLCVHATTYYVSNSGDDSNPGTSEELPWETLNRVNHFFRFKPGDQILFKRGDSWTGTITVRTSGTSGSPIVYRAYGTGDKPKIYGSEVITGWTLHEGNIWKATVTDEVAQVFMDGERMQLARYPNEGYFTVTSKTSNTVFESTDLDGGMNYAGATCFIKSNPWSMPAVLVASSSSQTITLESAPPYGVAENYGFWLVDKLEFLTQAGEWYYDSGADTLYFWTPNGDSPDNYIVRASTLSQNVNITGRSYVTIKDIELRHSGVDGIYVSSSSNIQIKNCIVDSPDRFGIYELSGSNILVDNNQIEGAGTAIRTMGQSNTITNNLIQNTGLIRNFNKSTVDQDGMGMFVRGNNHVIHYNRVINTGYIGIASNGLNISIKYNYINGACSVLDDGAGIYVSSGTTGSYPRNDFTIGTVIESNIIENVHGTMDGKPSASAYPHGNGIYLDWSPKGVTIKNNVVNFVSQGLYIQGGGQNVVEGNIFMDAMIGYRYNAGNEVNTYKENIIYQTSRLGRRLGTTSATAQPLLIYSNTGEYGLWSFEDNAYVARYYQTNIFRYTNSGGTATNTSDFSTWQTETGDATSTFLNTPLAENETERLFYNDTKVAKTYYLNNAENVANAVTETPVTTSFVLQPFTGVILKGLNLDCIFDYEDSVAPLITEFTLPETSESFTIAVSSLVTTGEATQYLLKTTDTNPDLTDSGWQDIDDLNYSLNETGELTVYAFIRDAAGNISTSASDDITITLATDNLGYETIFANTSANANLTAQRFTMPEDGVILSVSVYHLEGTDDMQLAVYADTNNGDLPGALLGVTPVTAVADSDGWQTIELTTPLEVSEGTIIWLAWLFETNPGVTYETVSGSRRARATSSVWGSGMTNPFPAAGGFGHGYSIYCTYTPQ